MKEKKQGPFYETPCTANNFKLKIVKHIFMVT